MGEITYLAHTGHTLEQRLAQDVSSLVNRSFKDANKTEAYSTPQESAFLTAYTAENLRILLPPITTYFAYDGTKLIGTGFLAKGKPGDFQDNGVDAFLYGMYVDPRYKGQGIGSEILRKLLDEAKKQGIRTVHALATDFPKVVPFYLKHGFEYFGQRELRFGNERLKFHEIRANL